MISICSTFKKISFLSLIVMDINYHLLIDILLVSGALSFVLIVRKLKKMIQILETFKQAKLIIYLGGWGFVSLESFLVVVFARFLLISKIKKAINNETKFQKLNLAYWLYSLRIKKEPLLAPSRCKEIYLWIRPFLLK